MRKTAVFLGMIAVGAAAWACSSDSGSSSVTTTPLVDAASITECNGHAELCDRAYTAVAFPGCHDSYATVPDSFVAADQDHSFQQELDDKIRVFHLEMQSYQADAYLCHSICGIGNKLLSDELTLVANFAKSHPNEVITLLMESQQLTTDQIAAAFDKSGLTPMLHAQPAGTPWPTLRDLIQKGEHVVVFLADLSHTGGTSFPWMHDRFARTWETPWDNKTPQDFARCDADRGTKGNDIYVVDTYREDSAFASVDQAQTVNPNPFLIERLLTCKNAESTLPNFVMVNFYEYGDLLKDVDILNGLAPDPGEDLSKFPPSDWPGTDAGVDSGSPDDAGDGGDGG